MYENFDQHPFARKSQNLFSFWYLKIKNCGMNVPNSVIVPTPPHMHEHFYMETPEKDIAAIQNWVDDEILPAIKEGGLDHHLLFVKNSVFSNKFDAAKSCLVLQHELANAIASINYKSICFGADGTNEIVVRERIRHDDRITPCIYGGLPFRPEFRVFYDFDKKDVIFTANYWDYDYVYPHLYSMTDKIIFDARHEYTDKMFAEKKAEVEQLVKRYMPNVAGLEGPWSIDIMWDEVNETYWLIDMAVAERSAYWKFRPGNEEVLRKQKEDREKMLADMLKGCDSHE